MDFIHGRKHLAGDQYVRIDCDTQCNVMLTDDANFSQYKRGRSFRYYGGFFKKFPAVLTPPYPGYWNIVVDLGGANATIKYSIQVVKIPL